MITPWICPLLIACIHPSYSVSEKKHYVLGGVEADIWRFPFTAWISYLKRTYCGGIILNKNMVLTSAHCEKPNVKKHMIVFVGAHFKQNGIGHNVCKFVKHEKNIGGKTPFDIAIILLSSNIAFNDHTQPARIANHHRWRKRNSKLTVIGYGRTLMKTLTGSSRLMMTDMHYIDSKDCEARYPHKPVPAHMFCIIGRQNNGDCYGDSGSAVIWQGFVVGLVTRGRWSGCGSTTVPSMHVDLFFFKTWIKQQVQKLNYSCNEEKSF